MTLEAPFGLLSELTYRCPLACAYCSNPLEMAAYNDELSTQDWQRVFAEAAELGVLQCHLSGGEPLLRRDLVDVVAGLAALDPAPEISMTTNGVGLAEKAGALASAGLSRINVSLDTLHAESFARLARRDG